MKLIIEQEFLMDVDQAFAKDHSICIGSRSLLRL